MFPAVIEDFPEKHLTTVSSSYLGPKVSFSNRELSRFKGNPSRGKAKADKPWLQDHDSSIPASRYGFSPSFFECGSHLWRLANWNSPSPRPNLLSSELLDALGTSQQNDPPIFAGVMSDQHEDLNMDINVVGMRTADMYISTTCEGLHRVACIATTMLIYKRWAYVNSNHCRRPFKSLPELWEIESEYTLLSAFL